MSSLVSAGRVRAPRAANVAIDRARLALVPSRTSRAPRAPFAVLVFLILGAGVVGLLMFNTHMQQSSFYATSLEQKAVALAAKRQALEMELEAMRDPQALAVSGRKLGMVIPRTPAFVNLASGGISGTPTVATPDDLMRVGVVAHLPASLNKKPIVVLGQPVTPATTTTTTGQTPPANGAASPPAGTTPGRKNTQTTQGVHR